MTSSTYKPVIISDDFKGYPVDLFGLAGEDCKHLDHLLISNGQIRDRVKIVAKRYWDNWDGRPLLTICIMNGASRFFELFIEALNQINVLSQIKKPFMISFLKLSNYTSDKMLEKREIFIPEEIIKSVRGKHLLAVEDITDTGHSMTNFMAAIDARCNVLSHQCLSMTTKRTTRNNGYKPEYCCFEIPDRWVVGFGLDFNNAFRHYDHVYAMSQQGIQQLLAIQNASE